MNFLRSLFGMKPKEPPFHQCPAGINIPVCYPLSRFRVCCILSAEHEELLHEESSGFRWDRPPDLSELTPSCVESLINANFNDLPFSEKLEHVLSKGKVGRHSLEGGWCPLCGEVYYYDPARDGTNWNTKGETTVVLMLK